MRDTPLICPKDSTYKTYHSVKPIVKALKNSYEKKANIMY